MTKAIVPEPSRVFSRPTPIVEMKAPFPRGTAVALSTGRRFHHRNRQTPGPRAFGSVRPVARSASTGRSRTRVSTEDQPPFRDKAAIASGSARIVLDAANGRKHDHV